MLHLVFEGPFYHVFKSREDAEKFRTNLIQENISKTQQAIHVLNSLGYKVHLETARHDIIKIVSMTEEAFEQKNKELAETFRKLLNKEE